MVVYRSLNTVLEYNNKRETLSEAALIFRSFSYKSLSTKTCEIEKEERVFRFLKRIFAVLGDTKGCLMLSAKLNDKVS